MDVFTAEGVVERVMGMGEGEDGVVVLPDYVKRGKVESLEEVREKVRREIREEEVRGGEEEGKGEGERNYEEGNEGGKEGDGNGDNENDGHDNDDNEDDDDDDRSTGSSSSTESYETKKRRVLAERAQIQKELEQGSMTTLDLQGYRKLIREVYFDPRIMGIEEIGLVDACKLSVSRCKENVRQAVLADVVVTGGMSRGVGFVEDFEGRLREEIDDIYQVNVRWEDEKEGVRGVERYWKEGGRGGYWNEGGMEGWREGGEYGNRDAGKKNKKEEGEGEKGEEQEKKRGRGGNAKTTTSTTTAAATKTTTTKAGGTGKDIIKVEDDDKSKAQQPGPAKKPRKVGRAKGAAKAAASNNVYRPEREKVVQIGQTKRMREKAAAAAAAVKKEADDAAAKAGKVTEGESKGKDMNKNNNKGNLGVKGNKDGGGGRKRSRSKGYPADTVVYKVGQLVEGRWQKQSLWYKAVVVREGEVKDGGLRTWDLSYEDGDFDKELEGRFIRERKG
ncbi:hypothetical protein TrCOL_g3915 [Triparma columacea]|uniref:Tudor domain-containing protein n=1 Tax=Triparma columacea TaxID=722753 RepID=A0A9W7G7V7_9STRA|nr:hypothetical protein TrCOL_g3915 [Triparma columacea]